MLTFVPDNKELAQKLDEKLAKLPFANKENLVSMFNTGLINRKSDLVKELVQELAAAYKGVECRPDAISLASVGEITANELIAKAEAYRFALKLQRIVKENAAEYGINDSSFIFVGSNNLITLVVDDEESGDVTISTEKLNKLDELATREVAKLLRISEFELNTPFEAVRVLGIDGTPVELSLEAFNG